MKIKKIVALGAAFGVALAGFGVTTAAQANPVSPSNGYSIVGSDTLQDAVNALTNGTSITGSNVRVSAAGKVLSSFDAFPTAGSLAAAAPVAGALIQSKPFGAYFVRPAGSGNGKTALLASMGKNGSGSTGTNVWQGVNIAGQVDLARSSSGITQDANGDLVAVPFGRDAVSFAYKAGANIDQATINTVASYSASQLSTLVNAPSGEIVVAGDDRIVAILPQSGSGTREFFLKAIGFSDPKSPVSTVPSNHQSFPENNGAVLAPAADEIWVIPFSVASYVAQQNGAAPANTTAGITIGSPQAVAPFTGAEGNRVPNQAYYANSTWGRDTYILAPYAKLNGSTTDAALANALNRNVDASLASFVNGDGDLTSAGEVKQKFGFLAPSSSAPIRGR
jgi:hypothetical protein